MAVRLRHSTFLSNTAANFIPLQLEKQKRMQFNAIDLNKAVDISLI
jgi:hypothetical protein